MSATTNYSYSLTFRVPPTASGNLPAKRVFRSNPLEPTARVSSSATTAPANNNSKNVQGKELSVSASIPLALPPKSTTQYQKQQHSWQWRLTLIEEKEQYLTQGGSGGCDGRKGEENEDKDEKATDTEVDLSVELRGMSTASSLPSSGPFGGFLLQYKSFGLVAKNTRFTLVSKTIDSSSALSLQAKVKASHVLDLDGYYDFAIVLSTESLVHETTMAPLGSIFPRLFLSLPGGFGGGGGGASGGGGGGYLKLIDAIFDDPVTTDVVFIWQNKVMMVVASHGDSDSDSDSDDGGDGGRSRKQDGVTVSRLYAHQAVLHQYPYFRRKLPLPSSSSQGGGDGSSTCVMMPRKLLVRDFSLAVFRVILRWLYTRTLDTTGITDAQTAAVSDRPSTSSNGGAKHQQDDDAPMTWMEIYQIANNLELPELRVLAKNKMRQAQQV